MFDGIPPQDGENATVIPPSLAEPPTPRPEMNLARGIVWADILADIAADEEERQTRHLRDAA